MMTKSPGRSLRNPLTSNDDEVKIRPMNLDLPSIRRVYARYAPIYDVTFGPVFRRGRAAAVGAANQVGGRVLEVGVGTGLSLADYDRDTELHGIDISEGMLDRARARVARHGLSHVVSLQGMDAAALAFPDEWFDAVVAMFVMTVVPDPRRVLEEMTRVCRPGGKLVMVNHFAAQRRRYQGIEKVLAPFARQIGWHADMRMEALLAHLPGLPLKLVNTQPTSSLGLFTLVELQKYDQTAAAAQAAE